MKTGSSARRLLATLCLLFAWPAGPGLEAQVEGDPVDLVIVLDVSGTMRGLIDTTRLGLWEIVNDLAEAEPTPRLRVALVTFGNQRGSRQSGWVQVETDLTEDLDRVSAQLSRLTSRGADEMVGRALKTALEELDWSPSEHALRFLFVAGNESADQDQEVQLRWMSQAALDAGIFLSAVYCGPADDREAATWREMAELAEGRFVAIDHRTPSVAVETPFDRELVELGELLDQTTVPIGKSGARERRSRDQQDKQVRSLGLAAAAARAETKAGPLYGSRSDLVSLYESGELDRSPPPEEELPRELRKLTGEERAALLAEMQSARQEVRERIAELGAERRRYLAEQQQVATAGASMSFADVIRRTMRDKAEDFGYSFPDP